MKNDVPAHRRESLSYKKTQNNTPGIDHHRNMEERQRTHPRWRGYEVAGAAAELYQKIR